MKARCGCDKAGGFKRPVFTTSMMRGSDFKKSVFSPAMVDVCDYDVREELLGPGLAQQGAVVPGRAQ